MLLGMTIKGQLGANEPERSGPLGSERHFGWQDMFVGRDADPRGIGGIFVHHGDERTVIAGTCTTAAVG
jgi:hypothetical protein